MVVGRGCLGLPWLFGELSGGAPWRADPGRANARQCSQDPYRYAILLTDHVGENKGMRDLRKHTAWYFTGFPVGSELRRRFATVASMVKLQDLLGKLERTFPSRRMPTDQEAARAPLARSSCCTAG